MLEPDTLEKNADSLFKQVLKELRPIFKENGFRASSQNFILESAECWAIVNFQKSRWASPDEKTFYVNVAVTAKRLLAFEDEPVDKPPAYYSCIWNVRAEQLDPACKMSQWTVRNEDDVREVLAQLTPLLRQFVIPSVNSMMSEYALLEKWTGIDYRQLKARCVLHAASNKLPELREAIFTLADTYGKGSVSQGVQSHIERLRMKYPTVMQQL